MTKENVTLTIDLDIVLKLRETGNMSGTANFILRTFYELAPLKVEGEQ